MGLCVEMMVMRMGMQQAEYFIYGTPGEEPHHFALNFDYYTHFTSPIRRYPDVMVHRVLGALLGLEDEYQQEETAQEQVAVCNEKRSCARKTSEQLDRAVFCIYLRSRKEWFYTVGTVLGMKPDEKSGKDIVTVYSSQLGKEKKIVLLTQQEANQLELYKDLNEDDEVLLPQTWKFGGRGSCDVTWEDPARGDKRIQTLKVFSCLPVVIIPTNTVPIDFAMFLVSPFHKRFRQVDSSIGADARKGFDFTEDVEEDVDIVHNADEN